MPVQTSYPGIYIEELPSTTHNVVAAPTSITVFIGFTNPFWQAPPNQTAPPFNQAAPVQSFSDYQTAFGGFFSWPWLPDYVGQAVYQFFVNGGAQAYVVALQATDPGSPPEGGLPLLGATAVLQAGGGSPPGDRFTFTALQPVGDGTNGLSMSVTISNLTTGSAPGGSPPTTDDTADVTISYFVPGGGPATAETYRRVQISKLASTVNQVSRLATVSVSGVPTTYDGLPLTTPFTYTATPLPPVTTSLLDPSAFASVFQANAPLDKVSIFNLMAMPGVTDQTTLAQALVYCEGKRAFYIMDPATNAVADGLTAEQAPAGSGDVAIQDLWDQGVFPPSTNGALYFPWLQTTDPVTQAQASSPPSGYVAGIFAQGGHQPRGVEVARRPRDGDQRHGVDRRRASGVMTDAQQGVLNERGINCLRSFPGVGARGVRRPHPGLDEPRLPAVEVRGRPPDGAVHRAVAVRQSRLGGVRTQRPRRCGMRSPRRCRRSCSACTARARSRDPRRARHSTCSVTAPPRPRPTSTTASSTSSSASRRSSRPSSSSSRSQQLAGQTQS